MQNLGGACHRCFKLENCGTSNHYHYHYTMQLIPDWIKARKNWRRAGGKWYGLGSSGGWF
jgi:hypothetical protein